jgi:hypothetical protein
MFVIDEKLLVAILNYLKGKPYFEVAEMIQAIEQCRRVEIQEEIQEENKQDIKNES